MARFKGCTDLFNLPQVKGDIINRAEIVGREAIISDFVFDEPRIWAVYNEYGAKDGRAVTSRSFVDKGYGAFNMAFTWIGLWQLYQNPSEGRHLLIARLGKTQAEQWARECLGRAVLLQDLRHYANAERKYNARLEREREQAERPTIPERAANPVADRGGDVHGAPRLPWLNPRNGSLAGS